MAVAPTSSTMSVGLWPGAPNRSNFIAQRTRYGLDSTKIYYRERGNRGSLDQPLVAHRPLIPGVLMAVEIDPRYGRGSHHAWTEGGVAAQDVDNINRLADEAAGLPEGAYCEIGSEFNLVAHYSTQTPDERRAGFQAFTIAVATALRDRASHVTRVCSGTQGLWSNDDPDAWLTPEVLALLDGIAADGYSKAYTARQKSMASMFDAPLAWARSKGLPFSVTEFGVEEHGDDGGAGKAQEYREAQAWIAANASTDGGATGLVHVMFNTSADGKAPDGYDWPPDLTPAGEAVFRDMLHAILP